MAPHSQTTAPGMFRRSGLPILLAGLLLACVLAAALALWILDPFWSGTHVTANIDHTVTRFHDEEGNRCVRVEGAGEDTVVATRYKDGRTEMVLYTDGGPQYYVSPGPETTDP